VLPVVVDIIRLKTFFNLFIKIIIITILKLHKSHFKV